MIYAIENIKSRAEQEEQEIKTIITEMKHKLEGIKRLNDAEECISELENRIVELTEAQQKKERE